MPQKDQTSTTKHGNKRIDSIRSFAHLRRIPETVSIKFYCTKLEQLFAEFKDFKRVLA